MITTRMSRILYFFAVAILLFDSSFAAGNYNGRASSEYTKEATRIVRQMDQSVNPCDDFYKFACGGYMKSASELAANSDRLGRYYEMMDEAKKILESERELSGYDISAAKNIYASCKKLSVDPSTVEDFMKKINKEISLHDDIVDGFLKLREMGFNNVFLFELFVSPRSKSDQRNILEIRPLVLRNELKIVKAGEFIKSLDTMFPMQKFIEGFLPKDVKFSLDDEIRVDEAHIKNALGGFDRDYREGTIDTSFIPFIQTLIKGQVVALLPWVKDDGDMEKECMAKAIEFDSNFQVAISKHFLNEDKKNMTKDVLDKLMKTIEALINHSSYFDDTSRASTLKALSNMEVLIAHNNNTIQVPTLDWNDVDFDKYARNILKLSKFQLDAKFRQLNLVNDVREWNNILSPTSVNAQFNLWSNELYLPALFMASAIHNVDFPNYIQFGTVGFSIAHELGHAIGASIGDPWESPNIAGNAVMEASKCLKQSFNKVTEQQKSYPASQDFHDLLGYKIAYHSLLDAEKQNGADQPLPGLNYNSRQMFWISAANSLCSKDAYNLDIFAESPNYLRVLLPLMSSQEFAKDFNCPVGSPMNPEIKCNFL